MAARRIAERRSVTLLIVLLSVVSQTLLLAHAHRESAAPNQAANCLVCIAAQHASPACANTVPQVEPEVGYAPMVARTVSLSGFAFAAAARQRGPPVPA